MSDWKPDYDAYPAYIVCAACRHKNGVIVAGPRHYDMTMWRVIEVLPFKWEEGEEDGQGFVDQHGKFYTREEAFAVVQKNGQPFNAERNGTPAETLFSEGLY